MAMPVQLNEPLNTLQRLCEELEYSELLDRAAHTQDPFERMVTVGAYKHTYTVVAWNDVQGHVCTKFAFFDYRFDSTSKL